MSVLAIGLLGCAGPRIEPEADAVLRAMSARLASAEQLTVRGRSVLAGQGRLRAEAEDTAEVTVLVKRPDRLAQHVKSRAGERRACYDGRAFTIFDVRGNAYATIPAPQTIDGLLQVLDRDYGLALPLADLVTGDPYAGLTRSAIHGAYIGWEELGGTLCHHLAFDEENVVWELWVSVDGDLPVRQVAIGKAMDGQPGVGFDFTEVDLEAEHEESAFRFVPPAGAQEVSLERVSAAR